MVSAFSSPPLPTPRPYRSLQPPIPPRFLLRRCRLLSAPQDPVPPRMHHSATPLALQQPVAFPRWRYASMKARPMLQGFAVKSPEGDPGVLPSLAEVLWGSTSEMSGFPPHQVKKWYLCLGSCYQHSWHFRRRGTYADLNSGVLENLAILFQE